MKNNVECLTPNDWILETEQSNPMALPSVPDFFYSSPVGETMKTFLFSLRGKQQSQNLQVRVTLLF